MKRKPLDAEGFTRACKGAIDRARKMTSDAIDELSDGDLSGIPTDEARCELLLSGIYMACVCAKMDGISSEDFGKLVGAINAGVRESVDEVRAKGDGETADVINLSEYSFNKTIN